MRLLILRSSSCILFVLLCVLAATSQTNAKELTGSNVQSRGEGSGPVKQLGKRRLPAVEVADSLQKRAAFTNGKKSLWRSASTAARSLRARFTRDTPPMKTLVKRDQVTDFCARFSTNCTSYCKKLNLTSKSYLCSQASSTTSSLGLSVRCKCGTTDYTANVLLSQAPSAAVKIAGTAVATTVQTVVKVSTIRATSSICKTIATTTTVPGSTSTVSTATTLPTITSVITSRTTLTPSTVQTTLLTTSTSTVVAVTGTTVATVTSTTTVYTTAYSTTVQVLAQGASVALSGSSSTAKTSSTSTKKASSSTTSTKKTSSSTTKSTATAKARDLDEDEVEEFELYQLDRRASTFCQAYLSACTTACSSHNGSASSKCTVASTNSYTLSCICTDGTSESRKALNVAQADTSSTTTSTVTNTVVSTRFTTAAATTVRTTTTSTSTVDGPLSTTTFTQFYQYVTDTTTTSTRPATTTYWHTVISTIKALTTSTSTSTSTPKTTTTLSKTTTLVTTKTSTSTKATTSTSSTKTSTSSAGPSQIQVRDYTTTSTVYGLLSTSQDEDAYAFLLDSTSEDGMFVNVIASTVTSSISGLVGLQMNDTTDYGNFDWVGFEVQDLSDTGVQPNMLEYLLLTDTEPVSTTVYPSTSNSDTGYFAAESFAWTKAASGKLTPIWTNPSGSTPTTATMQMFMLCSGSGYSDCFVSAAYNSTTWTNFDTSGVTITRVNLYVV